MYRFKTKTSATLFTGWLLAVGGARSPAEMPEGWCAMGSMMAQAPCTRGACDDPINRDPWIANVDSPMLTVTLRFNVFCENNGLGCVATAAQVDAQVAVLNTAFLNYNIRFVPDQPAAPAHFISNSRFKNFCSNGATCWCGGDPWLVCGEELAMKTQYANDPAHKLNIYVVQVEPPNSNYDFIGLGHFPWWPSATAAGGGIIIEEAYFGGLECGDSGIAPCLSLGHEIGHNLGLWHNFHGVSEVPNCGACFEVAACNGDCSYPGCDAVGDLCCDTAATPTRRVCYAPSGGSSCGPGGYWSQDEATYLNYMNYAGDGCWNGFSSQQTGRMRCWTCDSVAGWIAGPDCNNNERADVCDLADGTSMDCNCNTIPDSCDIANRTSQDSNQNGVPDECESPPKACCLPDDSCVVMTACSCAQAGGTFLSQYAVCHTWTCGTIAGPSPGP
jgi:hypothetical protein